MPHALFLHSGVTKVACSQRQRLNAPLSLGANRFRDIGSFVGTMAGQMIMQGFIGFRIPLWVRRS